MKSANILGALSVFGALLATFLAIYFFIFSHPIVVRGGYTVDSRDVSYQSIFYPLAIGIFSMVLGRLAVKGSQKTLGKIGIYIALLIVAWSIVIFLGKPIGDILGRVGGRLNGGG